MLNLDPKDLLIMDNKKVITPKKKDITLDDVIKLASVYPNDMDLGRELRRLIESSKD